MIYFNTSSKQFVYGFVTLYTKENVYNELVKVCTRLHQINEQIIKINDCQI
jgi:hypothetical protein